MDPKRMKIVEFDDEGRPVELSGPNVAPRARVDVSGGVKIVTFDDEGKPTEGVREAVGQKIKIKEFDGAGGVKTRGDAAPAQPRPPLGQDMKIVEFDKDGSPRRHETAPGRRDIKIVEFD